MNFVNYVIGSGNIMVGIHVSYIVGVRIYNFLSSQDMTVTKSVTYKISLFLVTGISGELPSNQQVEDSIRG